MTESESAPPVDYIAETRATYDALGYPRYQWVKNETPAPWAPFGSDGEIAIQALRTPVDNFYMTDPISRASATMAECTASLSGAGGRTGTDG